MKLLGIMARGSHLSLWFVNVMQEGNEQRKLGGSIPLTPSMSETKISILKMYGVFLILSLTEEGLSHTFANQSREGPCLKRSV